MLCKYWIFPHKCCNELLNLMKCFQSYCVFFIFWFYVIKLKMAIKKSVLRMCGDIFRAVNMWH